MGIIKEFKEFAVKGNMIDMAVGIIIGASFNNVVNVMVKQVIMPPLSLLTNDIHLSDKKIILRHGAEAASEGVVSSNAAQTVPEVAIGYGALIEAFLDFIIVGFVIFLVIKVMNRFRQKAQDPHDKTVETPKDIQLLSDLTELIQEQNSLIRKGMNKN